MIIGNAAQSPDAVHSAELKIPNGQILD